MYLGISTDTFFYNYLSIDTDISKNIVTDIRKSTENHEICC